MGPADTWFRTKHWLQSIATSLPERPKAILMISGHWEEPAFAVGTNPRPGMIFDYYGFPPHTYELDYPAPGDPALAERVRGLLAAAGLPVVTDPERGFDHGIFVPLLVAFPDADIPVVPLSLKADLDPAEHLAAGRALEPLRDEGVLIVGSGMSYHNMRGYMTGSAPTDSANFDAWLTAAIESGPDERASRLTHWTAGDAARQSHPREEHLMPLMVAAGAAGAGEGSKIFSDQVMMATVSAFRFD